jgi:phosphopantothenoylcysteine decarboxylase/phosphopantothenate--cysteine ligase
VGFAAETDDLAKNARDKLARKNVPLMVGNIGPSTFGRDVNSLLLVDARGERPLPSGDKLSLARELVREVSIRLEPLP